MSNPSPTLVFVNDVWWRTLRGTRLSTGRSGVSPLSYPQDEFIINVILGALGCPVVPGWAWRSRMYIKYHPQRPPGQGPHQQLPGRSIGLCLVFPPGPVLQPCVPVSWGPSWSSWVIVGVSRASLQHSHGQVDWSARVGESCLLYWSSFWVHTILCVPCPNAKKDAVFVVVQKLYL